MHTQKIWTRDFVLGFFAQFAFSSSFHILIPTLPIYLSRMGATDADIGVLIGISSVASLVFRPFIGKALLKIPEKNFMIIGGLLITLTSTAYLFASSFWSFFIVRIFQGIGLAFFYTASFTLIANISPEAHRGKSLGYFYLALNIALALAPPFGMFLINLFSFNLFFMVCTCISLCSLFLTIQLGKRQVDPLENSSFLHGPFLSIEALPPAIMAFFTYIIWGTLTTFFPLYALNHGVTNPGLFFAAYAIVVILGRALGGRYWISIAEKE